MTSLVCQLLGKHSADFWIGVSARPVLDSRQKVIVVLTGCPDFEDYLAACDYVNSSLTQKSKLAKFSLKDKFHT
jgi:hypothetical protein